MSVQAEELGCSMSMQELVELNNAVFQNQCLISRAGFDLLACLIRLPTEPKLKILKSLPGTDIARIGCAYLEMQYLPSNNDLWKQKFMDFGSGTGVQGTNNWKVKYVSHWESKKKRKREMRQLKA